MMLYILYIKALGLVLFDNMIFKNCILKTYLLTPRPTYATKKNGLNKFGRGPPWNPSCEVWSKSNEQFQRRICLSKNIDAGRTTEDNGHSPVTKAHPGHKIRCMLNILSKLTSQNAKVQDK